MGVPKLRPKLSIDEYLAEEKTVDIRHEFINGEVFAMSGTSRRHNLIHRNLLERLLASVKKSDCEIFYYDFKVFIEPLNRFYYPDLVVACESEEKHEYYLTRSTIIVEILSPTTALTDRREKLFAYQEINSLQEYVMIDQETEFAELYRRRDDGLWSWIVFEANEDLEFESINFRMPMKQLYQ